MQFRKYLLTVLAAGWPVFGAMAAGQAKRVVLVVWDGMRADFVSEKNTPNLCALAKNGVSFLHHHPVYPSMTEVNATVLATGVYPEISTVIANKEYRPAFDPLKLVETDQLSTARRGDALTGNHYIAVPTLAEILRARGLKTIVAGTKPVALLHDRAPRGDDALGIDVYAGDALPQTVADKLRESLGKIPDPKHGCKIKLDEWTTSAVVNHLWEGDLPIYTVLWLAEPDYSQHYHGPGSPTALAAIKSSDRNLGRVLQALRDKDLIDSTDVIVVSDHGFSTIVNNIDLAKIVRRGGFQCYDEFPAGGPKDGDMMVIGNGAEFSCYVIGHDRQIIQNLVHFLQTQPFTGVIFSREPMDGAFLLSEAKFDSPYAPDIAFSSRWKPDQSKHGAPYLVYNEKGNLKPGGGQHASLSPSDMHNICFASGPDFARGMRDSLPTGNIDIVPTILWLLGIDAPEKLSGRVLSEALTIPGPEVKSFTPRHMETEENRGGFIWRQYLDTSEVNGVIYFDQGNSEQVR